MEKNNTIQKIIDAIYTEPKEKISYSNNKHGYIEREDCICREELEEIGCEVDKVLGKNFQECECINDYTEYVLIPYSKLDCNKYGAVLMCSHHAKEIQSKIILENIVNGLLSSTNKKLPPIYNGEVEEKSIENAVIYSCGNVEFIEGKKDFKVNKLCPKCTEAHIETIKY